MDDTENTTVIDNTENTTEMDNTENNDALMTPFNVDGTIIQEPETQEDDIQPESLSTTIIEETEIEFEVFEEGTKKGKPLLVCSDGFRYYLKKKLQKSVLWSCSRSSAKCRCYASVVQKQNVFSRGPNRHTHQPEPALHGVKPTSYPGCQQSGQKGKPRQREAQTPTSNRSEL